MSGGTFDYKQYELGYTADQIEQYVEKNGRKKLSTELASYENAEWIEKYPEVAFHYKYSDEVIQEFKNAIYYLRKAAIYTQRVDWLLAGDDGEDTFIERLKEELTKLEK